MKLITARVTGYQSFLDTEAVEFLDGINLLIGQNNAGKSALLRALLPTISDDRHRTPERWEDFRLPAPQVDLTIEFGGSELREWILRSGGAQYFPTQGRNAQLFMDEIFALPTLQVRVSNKPNSEFFASYPSHGLFQFSQSTPVVCAMVSPQDGELSIIEQNTGHDTLPSLILNAWRRDRFYFAAERLTVGESGGGYAARLSSNANNLPNVLHTLSSERGDLFNRLVGHLREVFSTVGNLSVRTRPENNHLEIRVWPTEAMDRVELSFPLNLSGTGISQVVALLTAIMTIEKAVIIIDEINSFLHPAAIKSLLRILQTQYNHHQYIISTHAPEVISFSNPKTIHLLKRTGYESIIERLNLDDVGHFREIAEHLGISTADVFAAERVVWVEGPTEELCFPYLHQQTIGPLPRGTIVTSVAATGDFNSNRRDPAIVYEVYHRLSAAAATLVVSVAFSFDSELLTEAEKAEMARRSGGLLHFLPRRHFECYLLDPSAICDFIQSKDEVSRNRLTVEATTAALIEAAAERPFAIPEWAGDIADENWLSKVDAANLIKSVCGKLSDQRARFSKKDDSLSLMKSMLVRDPDSLRALSEYVATLISPIEP